jgi:hypothetical protein
MEEEACREICTNCQSSQNFSSKRRLQFISEAGEKT